MQHLNLLKTFASGVNNLVQKGGRFAFNDSGLLQYCSFTMDTSTPTDGFDRLLLLYENWRMLSVAHHFLCPPVWFVLVR